MKRVVLLCEDRAHLDFLNALCIQLKLEKVSTHVAPRGRGCAFDWVEKQFPARLRELVGKRYPDVFLLVALDGDNEGRSGRLRRLRSACKNESVPELTHKDPVALLVPTWSIDTWLVFFNKWSVIPEDEKAKSASQKLFSKVKGFSSPGVPIEDVPRTMKKTALKRLVQGFLGEQRAEELPSLEDARQDLRRCLA